METRLLKLLIDHFSFFNEWYIMLKVNVLFICLGNICRSCAAAAIFSDFINKKGKKENYNIDSAGTSAAHVGEFADSRMINAASRRDCIIDSIARKFNASIDFNKFDYIICMDHHNFDNISRVDEQGLFADKIYLLSDFSNQQQIKDVPDPYAGGAEGFNIVLDMLTDACQEIYVKTSLNLNHK